MITIWKIVIELSRLLLLRIFEYLHERWQRLQLIQFSFFLVCFRVAIWETVLHISIKDLSCNMIKVYLNLEIVKFHDTYMNVLVKSCEFGRDLEVIVIPKSYAQVVKLRNESIIWISWFLTSYVWPLAQIIVWVSQLIQKNSIFNIWLPSCWNPICNLMEKSSVKPWYSAVHALEYMHNLVRKSSINLWYTGVHAWNTCTIWSEKALSIHQFLWAGIYVQFKVCFVVSWSYMCTKMFVQCCKFLQKLILWFVIRVLDL